MRRTKIIDEQQALDNLYKAVGIAVTQLTDWHRTQLNLHRKAMDEEFADFKHRLSRIERDETHAAEDSAKGAVTRQTRLVDPGRWKKEDIAGLRKSYKMSVKEFANLLGCSMQTVHNWEDGGIAPQKARLLALDDAKAGGKRRAWAKLQRDGQLS